MNNLKHMKIRCVPFDGLDGKVIYVFSKQDERREELFVLKDDAISCVDLVKNEESVLRQDVGEVVLIEPMLSQNAVCVCTVNKLLILNCVSKEFYQMVFEHEIDCLGWNHINDYVVVVFKNKTFKLFSFDTRLDLVIEGDGDLLAAGPTMENVGWGSSSTQFQGPQAASEPPDSGNSPDSDSAGVHSEFPEVHPPPEKNEKIYVSWRGSSEAFVISYVDNDKRCFKVYNYGCEVIGKTEDKYEVYGPVSWKPQGNIIAAAMYMDNKHCIGLFEKNGLFKAQFPVVDVHCPITFLSWSPCGTVLSVVQGDASSTNVSLYIVSNNKWYSKQHFYYKESDILRNLTWLNTDPQCVEIALTTDDAFSTYKFKFGFDVDTKNNILVSVNGKSLFIHEFGRTIDPPPSFTKTVKLENPINIVAFHPSKDLAVALDSHNTLYYFKVDEFNLDLVSRTELMEPEFPLNLHHLFWKDNKPHVIQESPHEPPVSILHEFDVETQTLSESRKFDVSLHPIEHIFAINNTMVIHTQKLKFSYKNEHEPVITFKCPFPLHVIPFMFQNDLSTFILTADEELYIDEELISKNITSMMVFNNYLFLTSGSLLYSTKLHKESAEILSCYGLSEFHVRPINESAYLVCMAGSTTNIVVFKPRGDLGVVSCRNMEIEILEEMLCKGKWGEAITFMRMSRLNWNLLIDLNPERFYDNLDNIVFECNSRNILNSIVGEINDENCLNTIYSKTIDITYHTSLNKRNNFLTRLGNFLDETGAFAQYLPTVIKICIDQNEIKKAMTYASSFINSESLDGMMKAEQAISLLKVHVQAEDLFNAALQIFDIKLADFISKKCQMNPLEVDPILDGLKKMSDLEKRISIHVKYQNWEEAITYMLRKDEPNKDEILNFITEHGVEKRAYIESLKIKLSFQDAIALLYVEKLIERGCHDEAALIFLQLQMYNQAMYQFKLCHDYQKCLEYLPYSVMDDEEKAAFFVDFAVKLVDVGKYVEAATIYEDQLGDIPTAIMTLVAGKEFKEALSIGRRYSLGEVIDLNVIPKIMDSLEMTIEQIVETTDKFKKYCERLKKLRLTKKYYYTQMRKNGGRIRGSGDAPESASSFQHPKIAPYRSYTSQDFDVKSIVSGESQRSSSASTSTTMTQKSIRKMEKLKQDVSEGSRFEDIALMRELHIMISQTFKAGAELREIFLRLIEYSVIDMNTLRDYQTKMCYLQQLMVDEVCNIWDVDFIEDSPKRHINENFAFMDEEYRTIPSEILDPASFAWSLEMLKD